MAYILEYSHNHGHSGLVGYHAGFERDLAGNKRCRQDPSVAGCTGALLYISCTWVALAAMSNPFAGKGQHVAVRSAGSMVIGCGLALIVPHPIRAPRVMAKAAP